MAIRTRRTRIIDCSYIMYHRLKRACKAESLAKGFNRHQHSLIVYRTQESHMQINEYVVDTHFHQDSFILYILQHEHIISFIHNIKSVENISIHYVCGSLFVNGWHIRNVSEFILRQILLRMDSKSKYWFFIKSVANWIRCIV